MPGSRSASCDCARNVQEETEPGSDLLYVWTVSFPHVDTQQHHEKVTCKLRKAEWSPPFSTMESSSRTNTADVNISWDETESNKQAVVTVKVHIWCYCCLLHRPVRSWTDHSENQEKSQWAATSVLWGKSIVYFLFCFSSCQSQSSVNMCERPGTGLTVLTLKHCSHGELNSCCLAVKDLVHFYWFNELNTINKAF